MTTIAFIGLGNMGGPMAGNLVKAGHEVLGVDLTTMSNRQWDEVQAAFVEHGVIFFRDQTLTPEQKRRLALLTIFAVREARNAAGQRREAFEDDDEE